MINIKGVKIQVCGCILQIDNKYTHQIMYDGFISQLINVLNSNFRNSRGGRLLLGGYPKGYKKAEHISTKVEIKP